jgi:hypothetical protein
MKDTSLIRQNLRGSTKFFDSNTDLSIIKQCVDDVQVMSDSYKLKNTKPKLKFYGNFHEMLQLLLLRQLDPNILDGKLHLKESMHKDFRTNPIDFSKVETGQEPIDEAFN